MVAVVLRVLSSPEGEVGVVVDEGGEEGGEDWSAAREVGFGGR